MNISLEEVYNPLPRTQMNEVSVELVEAKLLKRVKLPRGYKLRFYDGRDFPSFVELLRREWNLGYEQARCSHRYAAEVYGTLVLAHAQYFYTLTDDNDNPIGFTGLSSTLLEDVPKFKNKKVKGLLRFEDMLNWPEAGIPAELRAYYDSEENIENEQKSISNNFLTMLILDKNHRGGVLARRLMHTIIDTLELLANENENHFPTDYFRFLELSIYTTDKCSYKFYDRYGFSLVLKVQTTNCDKDILMLYWSKF